MTIKKKTLTKIFIMLALILFGVAFSLYYFISQEQEPLLCEKFLEHCEIEDSNILR